MSHRPIVEASHRQMKRTKSEGIVKLSLLEMKRKLESAAPTDDDFQRDQVPDRLRERRGYDIYVWRTDGPGCLYTAEPPTSEADYCVQVGGGFLKKDIPITLDTSVTRLSWNSFDEMWIVLKDKDSVCAVANDEVEDSTLQTRAHVAAGVLFLFGEKKLKELGYCADSSEHKRMERPLANVVLSLDITNEDCGDCPSTHYLDDYCHKDFGARYNEQIAISYLENKVKQVPVISHEETVQAAMKAFKVLLGEDFKGDKIKVYVVGKDLWIDRVLSAGEIKEHLAVISD